jgi:hypothetical protein
VSSLSLAPPVTTSAARPVGPPARPPPRRAARRVTTVTLTVLIAAGLTSCVLLVALVTHVALAPQGRRWLHYTFPGVPARLNSAVWIFTNNGRELLGVLGLLLIAQIAAHRSDGPTRAQCVVRAGGELVLAGAIGANVLVVGAAIGAYGERMVRAILPHGPFEVAAYSLSLALYKQGRRRPLPVVRLAGTIAASVALLALAALLETFR